MNYTTKYTSYDYVIYKSKLRKIFEWGTESNSVFLVGLELTLWTMLALNT